MVSLAAASNVPQIFLGCQEGEEQAQLTNAAPVNNCVLLDLLMLAEHTNRPVVVKSVRVDIHGNAPQFLGQLCARTPVVAHLGMPQTMHQRQSVVVARRTNKNSEFSCLSIPAVAGCSQAIAKLLF